MFNHVIKATKELVTDINIEFTETGIKFSSIDSLHIALISVYLDKESFKKY
ncbi:20623_t:CDS:1, partial [Cetraspora pellucida]